MALSTRTETLYKAFFRKEGGGLRTKFGPQYITYQVGETYTVEGNLKMCKNGYHACQDPFDCLKYYDYSDKLVMTEISVIKEDGFIVDGNKVCFSSYAIERVIPGEEWQTGTYTSFNGTRKWYKNGKCHRDGDKPAFIKADGTREWLKNGTYHRDGDGPTIIWADGSQTWLENGKLHRDDGPAIIKADGTREWYKKGKLHRDGDEPAVIKADGTQSWYKNGTLEWYKNGAWRQSERLKLN